MSRRKSKAQIGNKDHHASWATSDRGTQPHAEHHRSQDTWVGEVESTGEVVSDGDAGDRPVPKHISTTGRHLSDYPVVTAHETPAEREARRLQTIDDQISNLDLTPNDEDVQINRYRANHLDASRVGNPHEMIDDELSSGIDKLIVGKTADGGNIPDARAHEKAGARQGVQARHAAFKRLLGLPDDAQVISPVSGGVKK
jgi:hypothetical protein